MGAKPCSEVGVIPFATRQLASTTAANLVIRRIAAEGSAYRSRADFCQPDAVEMRVAIPIVFQRNPAETKLRIRR